MLHPDMRHQIIRGFGNVIRQTEARAAMRKYMARVEAKSRYKMRGPLTVKQVEIEHFNRPLNENDLSGDLDKFNSPQLKEAWLEVRHNYKEGDGLYFYQTDTHAGYVLIRRTDIIKNIITRMGL